MPDELDLLEVSVTPGRVRRKRLRGPRGAATVAIILHTADFLGRLFSLDRNVLDCSAGVSHPRCAAWGGPCRAAPPAGDAAALGLLCRFGPIPRRLTVPGTHRQRLVHPENATMASRAGLEVAPNFRR